MHVSNNILQNWCGAGRHGAHMKNYSGCEDSWAGAALGARDLTASLRRFPAVNFGVLTAGIVILCLV